MNSCRPTDYNGIEAKQKYIVKNAASRNRR